MAIEITTALHVKSWWHVFRQCIRYDNNNAYNRVEKEITKNKRVKGKLNKIKK